MVGTAFAKVACTKKGTGKIEEIFDHMVKISTPERQRGVLTVAY